MSRVGKQLIDIPAGVEVKIENGQVKVKGPKGQLNEKLHPNVNAEVKEGKIQVKVQDETDKDQRALWGLFGSLIKNMILGVTVGFSKKLAISGVGFRAAVSGQKLNLNVGYSHPVEFAIPAGIEVKSENEIITVSGASKQLVGEVAAQIRRIKKVEPYKGKGIRYIDEHVRRKSGKTATAKTE